jgi:hypothetical protein
MIIKVFGQSQRQKLLKKWIMSFKAGTSIFDSIIPTKNKGSSVHA